MLCYLTASHLQRDAICTRGGIFVQRKPNDVNHVVSNFKTNVNFAHQLEARLIVNLPVNSNKINKRTIYAAKRITRNNCSMSVVAG